MVSNNDLTSASVPLKPVERDSLYIKISDAIYSYVRMNHLQPGDKLPSERDMAVLLNTSRNSVREALRILEDRGLIHIKLGRGAFISNPYGEKSAWSLRILDCAITEMQELQQMLDRQAVAYAISRASEKEKEELLAIAKEMSALAEQNIYSHSLDHSFHAKLLESCRNTAVSQLIIQIREERFVRGWDLPPVNDNIWLPTIPWHLDLAQAIFDRKESKALEAIEAINQYGFDLRNKEDGTLADLNK